jgi:DNA-directed RNA polymerase specialized sigma24 family protein
MTTMIASLCGSEDIEQRACPEMAEARFDPSANPDLLFYRDRTLALLRRYERLSVETGRLPSVLGREFFRAKVTSYRAATFEDVVIFVHDVERSLEKLERFEQQVIARIVLQDYSQEEAAAVLGCADRTIRRVLPEALDRLSQIFLEGGILRGDAAASSGAGKACQEGRNVQNGVTCCKNGE